MTSLLKDLPWGPRNPLLGEIQFFVHHKELFKTIYINESVVLLESGKKYLSGLEQQQEANI